MWSQYPNYKIDDIVADNLQSTVFMTGIQYNKPSDKLTRTISITAVSEFAEKYSNYVESKVIFTDFEYDNFKSDAVSFNKTQLKDDLFLKLSSKINPTKEYNILCVMSDILYGEPTTGLKIEGRIYYGEKEE